MNLLVFPYFKWNSALKTIKKGTEALCHYKTGYPTNIPNYQAHIFWKSYFNGLNSNVHDFTGNMFFLLPHQAMSLNHDSITISL